MVKIFVGNIADGVTTEEMRDLFEQYGNVTECDVLGTYGFVHLATDAEAEHAIKNLDKRDVKGQQINVEKSKSGSRGRDRGGSGFRGGRGGMRGSFGYGGGYAPMVDNSATAKSARRAGCTKLHVANLPDGVYSGELRDLFSRYGYVAECDVVEDRKIAFVHIEDAAADAAIHALNGHNFKGIPLKVQMSKNQTRDLGPPGSGMRGGSRGGLGPRGGRGGMMGRGRPDYPSIARGFGRERGNGMGHDGYGSNGDSGFGSESALP
uniref:RRM domain-containing protein n=2 Tax=Ciona intestinalis TaxID=7719 RepID=H2XR28_CIOIN